MDEVLPSPDVFEVPKLLVLPTKSVTAVLDWPINVLLRVAEAVLPSPSE